MDLNLNKKVALVTGGSHGIGQAICVSLAEEGCDIAFCARGERYDLDETTRLVRNWDVQCLPIKIDTDAETSATLIVADTLDTYGRIDILINNVGGGGRWGDINDWEKTRSSVWEEVMMHNYLTTMWFTNKVIPLMLKQEFGRVIAISSIYGKERGSTPWIVAAKSAQIALMKSYSGNSKFVDQGITFNTICPGYVDVKKGDKEISVWGENKTIPINRYATPEEIAPIVTFLCSDKASYINGATITVDGGFTKGF